MSLSDKYRQQEEVEIFHEHYQKPPPEPVRPKKASISSQSTQSSKTWLDICTTITFLMKIDAFFHQLYHVFSCAIINDLIKEKKYKQNKDILVKAF